MKPILEIRNISKKFKIEHENQSYLSLRDKLASALSFKKTETEDFWALNDVSMSINPGETVAVIGKNGAGKSTLLKILSRITPPTSGSILVRGRIASLLEVGTGFHPELSGRENIFLNGSILGMQQREIKAHFDEIVDFSGVEKFLDTPLKRYSSGMQLRLAFAVAAFLEPEVLVIDEVLAVGDMEFQKKCLGKMEDVSRSGRTVIFVSHNMAAVKKLCRRGILLHKGGVAFDGGVIDAVDRYSENFDSHQSSYEIPVTVKAEQPGFAYRVDIEDLDGKPCNRFPVGSGWQVRVHFKILQRTPGFIIGLGMLTSEDIGLRTGWSDMSDIEPGEYEAVFREEVLFLGAGYYKLIVGMSSRMMTFQYSENCATLQIAEEVHDDQTKIRFASGVGLVLNPLEISLKRLA